MATIGTCNTCGQECVYSEQDDFWWHVLPLNGGLSSECNFPKMDWEVINVTAE